MRGHLVKLNRFDKNKTRRLCLCGILTWMFCDENLKKNWKFLNLTRSSLNTEASSTHFITLVLHTVMECTLEVKIASHGYHVYGKQSIKGRMSYWRTGD